MRVIHDSLTSIVYGIKRGDEEAFKTLFEKFFHMLTVKARRYLRDDQAAKDIVQEVFLNLWKNRNTLTPDVSIKNYLERACINRSLNYLRDQEKFYRAGDDWAQLCEDPAHYTPHSIVSFEELQKTIESAVATLPEKLRVPFALSRFENLTYREISAKTGLSQIVIEKCIMQALRRLRILCRNKGHI